MDKRRKVKNMVKKKANGNGYGVYSDYTVPCCTVQYAYALRLYMCWKYENPIEATT